MSHTPGESATAPVPRVQRAVDAVGILTIAAGIAVFLHARRAMDQVATGAVRFPDITQSNIAYVERFERLSQLGLGLVAAGLVLPIAALVWVKRRRQPPQSDDQADDS